jgi:hypothetical protein
MSDNVFTPVFPTGVSVMQAQLASLRELRCYTTNPELADHANIDIRMI